jgi:hypothetical protein
MYVLLPIDVPESWAGLVLLGQKQNGGSDCSVPRPRDGDTGPQAERDLTGRADVFAVHHFLLLFWLPLTNRFCSRVDSASCAQVGTRDRVARDPQCQRRRSIDRSVGQDG